MKAILESNGLKCTGCASCFNVCPVNALDMREDMHGFLYPHINNEFCIRCNQCQEVCPVLKEKTDTPLKEVRKCYAAMASDETRYYSSSGGIFSLFAEQVLNENGSVCGAAWEKNLQLQHILVHEKKDLIKLQKSKYVQSEIGIIYRKIKEELEDGKKVLFSGCPCQVAGLKQFLYKEYENLICISILCHGVPSQKMLRDSLQEFSKEKEIATLDFRDKAFGWDSLHLKLIYKDQSMRGLSLDESFYEQGFHYNLTLRDSCYDCKFCELPHEGDITLGDFWGIENYAPDLNDKKGTSLVLVNTLKGQKLFESVLSKLKAFKEMPLSTIANNRIYSTVKMHPNRKYFLQLYPSHEFNQSVLYALQNKFDIGLVGNWSYPNYGSELTYFALYSLLKTWNLSVRIISWPKSSKWQPYDTPQLFSHNPYPKYAIAPLANNRRDMKKYNNECDTFILGSDQLLNNNLYNWFDKFMQFDWVQNNKKKIAYSTSFGTDYIWGSDNDRAELAYFLQQFDAISVREDSAVQLAEKYYQVKATLVLDPVFLVPTNTYHELIKNHATYNNDNNSLFVYILNPTKEKSDAFLFAAKQLNLNIHAAGDGAVEEQNECDLWGIKTTFGLSIEQWLTYINNSKFIITDSFHGTCFAIIFKKPFISICNSDRGETRFTSLLKTLDLEERFIKNETELFSRSELFTEEIDYDKVYAILSEKILDSKKWLYSSIFSKMDRHKPFKSYDILDREIDEIYAQLFQQKAENEGKISNLKSNFNERNKAFSIYQQDNASKLSNLQTRIEESNNVVALNEKKLNILIDDFECLKILFSEKKAEFQNSIEALEYQHKKEITEINERYITLLNSKSYKIGHLITWLPRKLGILIKHLKHR